MFPNAAASSRKRCTVVTGMLLLLLALLLQQRTTTTTALTLTAGQRIAPLSLPRGEEATISSSSSSTQQQRRSLLDLPAVEQWASQHGLKEHHLKTIYRILLQTPPPTILQLQLQRGGEVVGSGSGDAVVACRSSLQERLVQASFPSKLAAQLLRDFDLCSLQLIERHPSRSGGEKLVLQLTGKSSSSPPERVETVLIRHDTSRCNTSSSAQQQLPRYTVCVSSQVGCARACTFCATGTLGLQRQLTSAELLEQVWMAQHLVGAILSDEPQQSQQQPTQSLVRNVVFMGMGEPLDNYAAVHEACRGLTHQCLFGLKGKHVTVSTVGVSPTHIRRLAQDAPSISLALSLHGATPALRSQLLPATGRSASSSLPRLEEALDYHAITTGRGVMLEYLLIDKVNDSDEACDALIAFCQRRQQSTPVYVNLIPYNPTLVGLANGYHTPSDAAVVQFQKRLQQSAPWRIQSHIRWSSAAGRDANGACGQLALLAAAASPLDSTTTTPSLPSPL